MSYTSENQPKRHICAGILAHVDAGKTTLAEGILYLTGGIRKLGRVDHQDAFLDNFAMERARGITIFSKQAEVAFGDLELTLIDTPGHVDFSAEMERTLQILDYAVLVISGADGVQSHVETLWRLLKKYEIPVFLFINKMDQPGTDRGQLLDELQRKLDSRCVDFSAAGKSGSGGQSAAADQSSGGGQRVPLGETGGTGGIAHLLEDPVLAENLALCDEALLEEYLEHGRLEREAVVELIASRKVFPCFFGSALKLQGVTELLEGLRGLSGTCSYPAEFAARVYKISRDAQGNRLTHMKITGGTLKVKALLSNRKALPEQDGERSAGVSGAGKSIGTFGAGKASGLSDSGKTAGTSGAQRAGRIEAEDEIWEEKVNQIRIYSGASFTAVNEVCAGMVCAVTGLTQTHAGEGLGAEPSLGLPVLEPVLSYQIILPPECDVHQTYRKLLQLEEEEPELHIAWNEHSNEIYAQLMGEVQIEILKSIIRERFGIGVEFGAGSIVYKETIAEPVVGMGHFEPLRHYAEVHLLMEPGEPGSGMQFATACSEDALDRNWQRLILTHLEEKQHIGVLTGSEITDMKITLIAGRSHLKHTEGGDFRQATYRAVRQGLKQAKSVLLEPVYEYRIEVPAECAGRAMTDIQKMHGSFAPLELDGETAVLTGSAPVVTMRGYQTELIAYTKGRGRISCTLKGYEPCHNAEEVIAARGYDSESDLENPTGSVFCAHGAGFVVSWDLVPEYVHLDTAGAGTFGSVTAEERTEHRTAVPAGPASVYDRSNLTITNEELEEIFARTYGPIKREKSAFKKTRRVDYGTTSSAPPPKRTPQEEYLLVDGYNIIFAWEELSELAKVDIGGARTKLMDILSNYQGYKKVNLILVFDAYRVEGGQGSVFKYHNIYVVYTKEAETADQYIEKTVHAIGKKYSVTVATSDALEQVIIIGQGGRRMSARDLAEDIAHMKRELRENYLNTPPSDRNYLFGQLDEETRQLMEDVRLGKKEL